MARKEHAGFASKGSKCIARPTGSYVGILRYICVVYVGNLAKFEQILEAMVEATKLSLK